MPQMSPLLWANLFTAFSLLLLISFIKVYFSNSKELKLKTKETKTSEGSNFSWMW